MNISIFITADRYPNVVWSPCTPNRCEEPAPAKDLLLGLLVSPVSQQTKEHTRERTSNCRPRRTLCACARRQSFPKQKGAEVHPSIFYTRLIQFRAAGGLEPIPAVIGREARYTLDRSPVHHRATLTNQTNNHPSSDSLLWSI